MRGKTMEKQVIIRGGGCGGMWGKQFHQQDRVYDRKGMQTAINASGNNGLVIKRWQRSEYGKRQNKVGLNAEYQV